MRSLKLAFTVAAVLFSAVAAQDPTPTAAPEEAVYTAPPTDAPYTPAPTEATGGRRFLRRA